MLPNTANIDDLILDFAKSQREKTQTFSIDESRNNNRTSILGLAILGTMKLSNSTLSNYENVIGGKIDGLAALKQSVYLMLSIEADQHIIYPYTYAMKKLDLIGKPSYYVAAVIPGRIKETLIRDDRITDVSDFEFEIKRNKLTVKFVVHTIYGEFNEETVVSY